MRTSRLQVEEYRKGILEGDRVILARAITLMESTLPGDQQLAGDVLDSVMAHSGNSLRIGITGAPGVGKSTFIETFGKVLMESGRRLAVLTIDPTSQITGGSILGDKTRMSALARDSRAFIRPSPAGRTLGGVASHTRETILLCEAAGFDTIFVETVGTGQSEIAIKNMVDFFLLLMQPGSGDELQGIKKGVVEMADAIAITKSDGDNIKAARATQADFQHALHLMRKQPSGWTPPVLTCSSLQATGLTEIRDVIDDFNRQHTQSGFLQENRKKQYTAWFHEHFNQLLSIDPQRFATVTKTKEDLQERIHAGALSPRRAAQSLLETYHDAIKNQP